MFAIMGWVLVITLVAPAWAALMALAFGRRAPRLVGHLGASMAGLGFLGSIVMGVGVRGGRVIDLTIGGVAWVSVDPLASVLLLLVFGVSAIVQSFAVRYLHGDARAAWFTGGAGLLTAASAGLITATTLIGLALCWSIAGIALCFLLATYWHLRDAREGVRRTAIAFLIGDLALWIAVALATATWGRIELRGIDPGRFTGPVVPVVAALIVLAALSRSAQIPFHRWLPATLAAPTPVSALLHAGVVNAGGILLIRLSALAVDDVARGLTVLAGMATMVYGTAVMMVKPDIKGALAHSTTAQMGFMILTCGLGLWAAAVIHLVAHGFYKSALFLSSGSAISRQRRHEALPAPSMPSRRQQLARGAAAVSLPALALLAGKALIPTSPGDHADEYVLLIFAWVTGGALTWGWLQRRPGIAGTAGAAAFLIPAAVVYVGLITAISRYLSPALPPSSLSAPTVWAVTAVALAALGCLAGVRRAPGTVQRVLYANALGAGYIPASSRQPMGAHL